MAIRGKVKDIKQMGNRVFGTVTDTKTGTDYSFEQPLGVELGIVNDVIVQFDTVVVGSNTVGVSLDPVEKGTIQTIDYDKQTGVLRDRVGNLIDFEQNLGRELGLVSGTKVRYALVTVDGQQKATALKLVANP